MEAVLGVPDASAFRKHLYLGDDGYEPEFRDARHLDLRKVSRGDHELLGLYIDTIDADIIGDAAYDSISGEASLCLCLSAAAR